MARPVAVKQQSDNAIMRYIRDTRAEVTKVTWPSREEGIRLTIIVVIATILSGIALYGMDFIFGSLIGLLIQSV